MNRRTFIRWTGAATVAAGMGGSAAFAGPFDQADVADHFVPADKKLDPGWLQQLFERGEPSWYAGKDLETIAMPVGGIGAGQLYLAGDGRLMNWDIFNQHIFTGYGRDNYDTGRKPAAPLAQGFAVQVRSGGQTTARTLDIDGFLGVRFCGEYPLGTVDYDDPSFPVHVRMTACSPFIPLDEADSALPATLLEFSLKNRTSAAIEVTLAGWLENAVACHSSQGLSGIRRNELIRRAGMTMVSGSARAAEPSQPQRPPIVLADFEGDDYGDWTREGEALGTGPAQGTLDRQQAVSGFAGKGLVNTYLGGSDRLLGRLNSPEFTLERRVVSFLVGGGNHAGKTCIHLLVDGQVTRTAVGKNSEQLTWHNWDVQELQGKQARIVIVDNESGPWGHINIDQIELRDEPRPAIRGPLEEQADFGTMGLALLGEEALGLAAVSLPDGEPSAGVFARLSPDQQSAAEQPFGVRLCGAVGRSCSLAPGEEATAAFAIVWCFPNRSERGARRGNFYATRFGNAADVAAYVAGHHQRLSGQTRLWHDTWYDSTLPRWLLDRLFSTTSTLATSTCQLWENGRFWAWEGVGCCHGTCTHVWNYEQSMARLFPRWERAVREMQDYDPQAGFVEETGMVRFRGEGWEMWAGDGQAGTVLKAYREHLVSADGQFLERNWPRIKKSLEFLIREDGDQNGILEGSQHNTYDINFEGPNTMVGSLYLAALRAGQEMAAERGDAAFAAQCEKLFHAGRQRTADTLFNGEYYIQQVDLAKHPQHQYGDGCLADQLFGQGWAHQVGLGALYPQDQVLRTLQSIWKYNWAPDVGPQNAAHPPERWFARPGEAGLFTCTWPKSKHLAEGVRYRDEVWTGIEYQVAGHMAWEGMLTETLAICRGIHDRYHPSRHNPWNEIECGDHYARGMASYGVFLGLCGFACHGPRGQLSFAPRISPESFQAAFTAAEGWGTFAQRREAERQVERIDLRWGRLSVTQLAFALPRGAQLQQATVSAAGNAVEAVASQEGERVVLQLAGPLTLEAGSGIEVTLQV